MSGPSGRRDFLETAAGVVLSARAGPARADTGPTGVTDREYWVGVARRLADPVLTNLANGTLKARMPVEQAPGANRAGVTHLEALGRLVAGIAPWLELADDGTPEGRCARSTPISRGAGSRTRWIPPRRTS